MIDFEFRRVTKEEMRDFFALESYVFADNHTLSQEKIDENPLKSEMTTCAFRKGQLVATGGGFPFKMRFNGHGVFADGVTAIGTEPAYRRRGLVRRIITERFEQAKEIIPGVYRRYSEDRTMNLHRHPLTWDFVHFKLNRHQFTIHFDAHDRGRRAHLQ